MASFTGVSPGRGSRQHRLGGGSSHRMARQNTEDAKSHHLPSQGRHPVQPTHCSTRTAPCGCCRGVNTEAVRGVPGSPNPRGPTAWLLRSPPFPGPVLSTWLLCHLMVTAISRPSPCGDSRPTAIQIFPYTSPSCPVFRGETKAVSMGSEALPGTAAPSCGYHGSFTPRPAQASATHRRSPSPDLGAAIQTASPTGRVWHTRTRTCCLYPGRAHFQVQGVTGSSACTWPGMVMVLAAPPENSGKGLGGFGGRQSGAPGIPVPGISSGLGLSGQPLPGLWEMSFELITQGLGRRIGDVTFRGPRQVHSLTHASAPIHWSNKHLGAHRSHGLCRGSALSLIS